MFKLFESITSCSMLCIVYSIHLLFKHSVICTHSGASNKCACMFINFPIFFSAYTSLLGTAPLLFFIKNPACPLYMQYARILILPPISTLHAYSLCTLITDTRVLTFLYSFLKGKKIPLRLPRRIF